MSSGSEFTLVEQPFIDQLVEMGWKYTTGNLQDPTATGRSGFRDVLIADDLEQALHRINLDEQGQPWLDDERIAQAVQALERLGTARLLETNQKATELLLKGTTVDGVDGWEQGRARTVHFIDWDHPENNTFRVVNQFQVECPPGQADQHIRPDLVLFVNGIPLVVVECKSPTLAEPMEDGIDQLQRYANRRQGLGIVSVSEGCERLFHYNQFVIATCQDQARVGTFTSQAAHFLEWKDTSPVPMEDVAAARGKDVTALSSQEKVVAGMLRPEHLLDIVRNFTLFTELGGKTVKIVCRSHQFRAVHRSIERLSTGKTRSEDGEHDRRGGVVWHTQGSGKSLTMVFLIRKMRTLEKLRAFKVIAVTDRKNLQKQLTETARLTDEPLTLVKNETRGATTISASEVLKEVLQRPGKDLVFTMIQKYRGGVKDLDAEDDEDDDKDAADIQQVAQQAAQQIEVFPELNNDEKILVLVDEAHRSHTNTGHANLMNALPQCAKIGFTGTPIIMADKKKTTEIFGSFIDRYGIKESQDDGATLKVLYEGRTQGTAVREGRELDELFEDMLADRTEQEKEAIRRKYATRGNVLDARQLIAKKARDMFRHYVENSLPNGFKAMVVANSRQATVTYFEEFEKARDELVTELEALDPKLLKLDEEEICDLPRHQAFLIRSHRFLPTIRVLDFAPVISGGHNDIVDPEREWSARSKINSRIARFRKPLFADGPNTSEQDGADPLAFLIVKSMLLTGFDAPIAQAIYLDRHIQQAELLQAVARVNRTYSKGGVAKKYGNVIDYFGVAHHLHDALTAYSSEDTDGCLQSLKDEIPALRDRHQRVFDFLKEHEQDYDDLCRLSDWDRKQLARLFASWMHNRIPDPERAAKLGDASRKDAIAVVDALERLLLVPTPHQSPDPYQHMHEQTVQGIKGLLSAAEGDAHYVTPMTHLLPQIEAAVFKILALYEPEKYEELKGKGLSTGILKGLIPGGRSRYTLDLSKTEFEDPDGWAERSSYENSVYDTVKNRNHVAHGETGLVEEQTWDSTVAMLLGLIDHNRSDLEQLELQQVSDEDNVERCIAILGQDERTRAEFQVLLKEFLSTLDGVLPRPEALPYANDAKFLTHIQARARNRYRGEERPIGKDVGEKVRQLIDEHIISLGIDPEIPPIEITADDFLEHIERERSAEAKASEMEHATRYHIRKHFEEDPAHYQRLSDRLSDILEQHEEQWDQQVEALKELIEQVEAGRQVDDELGLDPQTQAPFYDLIEQKANGSADSDVDLRDKICTVTVKMVDHIRQEASIAEFWSKPQARNDLHSQIF